MPRRKSPIEVDDQDEDQEYVDLRNKPKMKQSKG